MKIYINSKSNKINNHELALEIGANLMKAGYKVNVGKERDKKVKSVKYIYYVEYEEVDNEQKNN